LVGRHPGDEAHARGDEAQRRLRHRGADDPETLPRVLAVEAHGDGHVRAGREVAGVEADAVEGGRDREHVGSGQPGGAPEALVAVTRSRVDDLDEAHPGRTLNRASPYSTGSALTATTSTTVPERPAGIEFIIFITSIRQTTVSGSTRAPTS